MSYMHSKSGDMAMKQLTVRGVDDALHQALKLQAKSKGMSVNRYVIEVLRESTGQIEQIGEPLLFHDLDHLAGTWDEHEASAFEQSLSDQRQLDETIWS
jgi:hypothetical protein